MPLMPLCSRSNRSGGGGDQMGGARFPDVARHLEVEQIDHRTSATTTKAGLIIQAAYHPNWYPKASESLTPNLPPPCPSTGATGNATGTTLPHPEAQSA